MSKYSMIEVVREQFKKNSAAEFKCKKESKECLERKLPTRVFDSFPCLVPEDILKQYGKRFESLINSVILFNRFNKENLELEIEISVQFKEFLQEIAILSREQLLETNFLKEDIANEYGWEEYRKQFHIGDFICAFVGRVFQSLLKIPVINNLIISAAHSDALSSTFNFINKNYGLLVAEHLEQFNIKYTPGKEPSILKILREVPQNHPVATATAFSILVMGIGTIAATLFAISATNNNNNRFTNISSNNKPTP